MGEAPWSAVWPALIVVLDEVREQAWRAASVYVLA